MGHSVAATLATLLLLSIPALAEGAGPPPHPEIQPDSSGKQGVVLTVSGNGGDPQSELERAVEYYNKTLQSGIPITIYTTKTQEEAVRGALGGKARVKIVVLSDDADPDIFGSGFVRDYLPIPITVTEGEKKSTKYVIGTPNTGAGMTDALIKADEIQAGDVYRIPLSMDGGDVVSGGGKLYVTDRFVQKNIDAGKAADEAGVKDILKQYFGVDPADIVVLESPPSEASGHADMLVRPLPNGKVVVSAPGPGMNEADKAALDQNKTLVGGAVGPGNVVPVATPDGNPTGNYANAVVGKDRVLIPALGDAGADAAAKAAYEGALGPKYKVEPVDAVDMPQHGGGPHCRSGSKPISFHQHSAAGGLGSCLLSYDPQSASLCISATPVNLLSGPCIYDQSVVADEWSTDPMLSGGVTLQLAPLQLESGVQHPGSTDFTGGQVQLVSQYGPCFVANLTRLIVLQVPGEDELAIVGVLESPVIDNGMGSAFLDAWAARLAESSEHMALYIRAPIDLHEETASFTLPFTTLLDEVGLGFLRERGSDCAVGAEYCSAVSNSTGAPAGMFVEGTTSLTMNDLALRAEPVPSQPGIFFFANNASQIPFGPGYLCANGNIVRLPLVWGTGQVARLPLDLNGLSQGSEVMAGDQRSFQYWFRDPQGYGQTGYSFNTSNAVRVEFTP